ncbi:ALK and LTK ligand 2 [Melanotaenia boesemani]|uniref:ALK and LTK ligand 2 n=1 Tax=Melanotaenia boesemani TaxID=1250792 RepID=UPI001C03D587|nr:ALK and LTK ligand 2 [Melanotaenia boesemani]
MLLARLPVLSALLLLLLALATEAPRRRWSGNGRSLMELVSRYQRTQLGFTGHGARAKERGGRPRHGLEGHSFDPRHKERFITHLTGPLYFSPKCEKQFHRLYYNTRDCTVPDYYKRCARLLIQLANSTRCGEINRS